MHSQVTVRAEAGPGGGTVLTSMAAHGALAVRRTGIGQVHLVGTAAGPLGGDVVEVDVHVGAGARLRIDAVAATIALRGSVPEPARWEVRLVVEDGGVLEYVGQPLVVCAGADLRSTTTVTLSGDGSVDVTEQVLLGRHGEPGGAWRGRLVVDRDGAPVLRQSTSSAVLAAAPTAARALASRFASGETRTAATGPDAVALPLAAGGTLLTVYGATLSDAVQALAQLDDRVDPEGTAVRLHAE